MIGSWLDLLILFILALCLGSLPGRGRSTGRRGDDPGLLSVKFWVWPGSSPLLAWPTSW